MAILDENRMFGDIFKELRLTKDLSQDKIAEELDVSQGLITKWENHQSTPAPEMLDYIADYFRVSTDYLIGRTKNKLFNNEDLSLVEQYKILFDKDDKLTTEQKKFFIEFITKQHEEFDIFNNRN